MFGSISRSFRQSYRWIPIASHIPIMDPIIHKTRYTPLIPTRFLHPTIHKLQIDPPKFNSTSASYTDIIKDYYEKYSIDDVPYLKEWRELMLEMEKRKVDTKRIRNIICVLLGGVILVFFDVIRNWTSDQVTSVATGTLNKEEFLDTVTKFGEAGVTNLVSSEQVQTDVTNLSKIAIFELAKQQKVIDTLAKVFADVFQTKIVVDAGATLSADVVKQLLETEEYEWLRVEF